MESNGSRTSTLSARHCLCQGLNSGRFLIISVTSFSTFLQILLTVDSLSINNSATRFCGVSSILTICQIDPYALVAFLGRLAIELSQRDEVRLTASFDEFFDVEAPAGGTCGSPRTFLELITRQRFDLRPLLQTVTRLVFQYLPKPCRQRGRSIEIREPWESHLARHPDFGQ